MAPFECSLSGEKKLSQTNSHLILFPVTFSNYKGGIGRPAIMATFSLGSCGSSSFHPLHQLVSVIMLPTTAFKPGSGQKKAEGSLHLICLPVTGDLIPDFFETKKPFFCFLLKKKSMLYFFHLHKIWDWVLAKIGMVAPNRNLSLAVELRGISPRKLDEIFIIFQVSD